MTEEDEWYAPPDWGRRNDIIAFVSIVATAVLLHFVVYPKLPKPVTGQIVTQWQIPGTKTYCHPARLYYSGTVWRCV